jgi:hypothetical protein
MDEEAAGSGTVPVLFAGFHVYQISRGDHQETPVPPLHPPGTRDDVERLFTFVPVPVGMGAGRIGEAVHPHAAVALGLEDLLLPDAVGELPGGPRPRVNVA